jgi:hypothetical protein
MSNGVQSYVFLVEPETGAASVAESASAWMIDAGVMTRDLFDNVLSRITGHAPGPNAGNFVDGNMAHTLELLTNGVDESVGHQVEALVGEMAVKCPHCLGLVTDSDEHIGILMDGVGSWHEHQGSDVQCPKCHESTLIEEWDFGTQLALGNLVVRFWNWPPHAPSLRSGLETAVGMSSKLVMGRL